MEVFMYLWIAVIIFWLFGTVIAYVDYYKEYGKFKSFKTKITNDWEALKYLKYSWFGRSVESIDSISLHSEYASYSDEELEEAHIYACEQMLDDGFTIDDYESKEFSCVVYCMEMITNIAQYLAVNYDKELTAPLALFPYIKDSGAGHCIIQIDGKFYEGFAEEKYRGELELSDDEIESGFTLNI